MADQKDKPVKDVRVPQPVSSQIAIQLYYSKTELSNTDIKTLFGRIGSDKVQQLKRLAEQVRKENQVQLWYASHVNTKTAYQAWGIDVDELERRYNKLKKLGLQEVAG